MESGNCFNLFVDGRAQPQQPAWALKTLAFFGSAPRSPALNPRRRAGMQGRIVCQIGAPVGVGGEAGPPGRDFRQAGGRTLVVLLL